MKNTLLFFLLFCSLASLSAQVEVSLSPEPIITIEEDADIHTLIDLTGQAELTNQSEEAIELRWELFVMETPEDWKWLVSDKNISYTPGVTTNVSESFSLPVDLEPGEVSMLNVHIFLDDTPGVGRALMKLSLADAPDDFLYTGTYIFCVNSPESCDALVATDDIITSDIQLYPNPAGDYFSLTENEVVDQLQIYNLTGKLVQTLNATPDQRYDIAALPAGMYSITLVNDQTGRLITQKLVKK